MKHHAHPVNGTSIGCHKKPKPSGAPPALPAKETGIYFASSTTKAASETHLPFTKSSGLFFANSTSGYAGLIGTGTSYPSGTGVSVKAGVSSETLPVATYTIVPEPVTSSAGHLPYTKGAAFSNTISGVAIETAGGVLHQGGTGSSSRFAKPTASFSTITGRLPYTKSAGLVFSNTTSTFAVYTVVPIEPKAAVVDETSSEADSTTTIVVSTLPGHPLYTKSAGAIFTNSSAPAFPTGTGYATTFTTLISAVFRL